MSASTLFSIEEFQGIVATIIRAGYAIMEVYQENFDIHIKSDGSPVTTADQNSNKIIVDFLSSNFPYPIISEENDIATYSERKNWGKYWLVDPLDGTKEFIHKRREFTVNIALIENNQVVFGMIYVPVFKELFWAEKGKGSYMQYNQKEIRLSRTSDLTFQHQKIENPKQKNLKVIASRSHQCSLNLEKLLGETINYEIEVIFMGSSLKFCRWAQGKIDIYLRLKPTMEWDTAAGQIIVEEAQGEVLQFENSDALQYNKEDLVNPNFIVI